MVAIDLSDAAVATLRTEAVAKRERAEVKRYFLLPEAIRQETPHILVGTLL